ncbi:DUF2087 domain-containing protein [Streptomyces sp. NPDC058157]|uniref:DUF2087 domain-containing protein n=1 Tax=Streptomyces sp. NPDC058157 TaxID=3346360 RepID=UPI0036E74FCF
MSQNTGRPSADQQSADQQSAGSPVHEPAARAPRGVSDLFSGGRLVAIPRKAARREQLLAHLTETLFAPERAYSEPEVNDALRTVHEDCSALRRYLITSGHLTRTRDGSSYRRATTTR